MKGEGVVSNQFLWYILFSLDDACMCLYVLFIVIFFIMNIVVVVVVADFYSFLYHFI